jgi:hypothetical protein
MKKFKKVLVGVGIVGIIGIVMLVSVYGKTASAATPTLTMLAGGANSVQVSVFGDPNSAVNLYYYNQSAPSQLEPVGTIGTTNPAGYFSGSVNGSNYGISTGSMVYVLVNGQSSIAIQWPSSSGFTNYGTSGYGYGTTGYSYPNGNGTLGNGTLGSGTLTLSQNNVTLAPGQSVTIYAENVISNNIANNSYSNNLYLANNSNPSIASATAGSNQAVIVAKNYGTSVITLCGYNSSGCGTVSVVVSSIPATSIQSVGSVVPTAPMISQYTYQPYPVSFNQNNISLYVGQSATVMLSGGGVEDGSSFGDNSPSGYFIASNSGSGDVTTALNASNLTVYAVQSGSVTVTICSQSYTNDCSSMNLSIYPEAVQPPVLPSPIGITSPVIQPTEPVFQIPAVAPVVAIAPLSFSQSSVRLSVGQTASVTISGSNAYDSNGYYGYYGYNDGSYSNDGNGYNGNGYNNSYYVSNNSNPLAINAALNGNTLTVYAVAGGSGSLTVCSSYDNQCGLIAVTIANITAHYPHYPDSSYSSYPVTYDNYSNNIGYTQYPPYSGNTFVNTFANHFHGSASDIEYRW